MNESEYGPRTRRRAALAIAALLGFILALLPLAPATAATTGVTITAPAFDNIYELGTTLPITWATNAPGGTATVDLYDNGGTPAKIMTLATNVAAKAGKFSWAIPMGAASLTTPGPGTFNIRVTLSTGGATDITNHSFVLVLPAVAVTSPKGTDSWVTGLVKPIKWTTKASGKVALYLIDGSSASTLIKQPLAASAGSFNWDIPIGFVTASGTYTVQVKSLDNPAVLASSAPFTLNLPALTLTQPDTTVSWGAGTTQLIKWTSGAAASVKIELIDVPNSNAATTIATVPAKQGTYSWKIPPGQTLGNTKYKIRITSTTGSTLNSSVTDLSTAAFDIVASTVTVSQPDGVSPWVAGTTKKITWSTPVNGNVKVELTDTSGGNAKLIRASIAGTVGFLNWDIPLNFVTASGQYKVRVSTITTPAVVNSSASFQLDLPTITVADAAGAPWGAGELHNITWTTGLTTGTVKIEYVDNGNVVRPIKSGVSAKAGTFAWTLPATVPGTGPYTLRVTSTVASVITDDNTTPFAIGLPTLTANTPSNVTAGTGTASLTWTTSFTGPVKLDLVDSAGALVKNIKASVPASPATFSWAVPLNFVTATGTYKLKVTSTTNPAITHTSNGFTVTLPTITVLLPAAGALTAGAKTVTWSGLTVGSVKIELLNASNAVVSVLKSTVLASAGTAAVTIPALTVSSTYHIRITSLTNSAISDTEDYTT